MIYNFNMSCWWQIFLYWSSLKFWTINWTRNNGTQWLSSELLQVWSFVSWMNHFRSSDWSSKFSLPQQETEKDVRLENLLGGEWIKKSFYYFQKNSPSAVVRLVTSTYACTCGERNKGGPLFFFEVIKTNYKILVLMTATSNHRTTISKRQEKCKKYI